MFALLAMLILRKPRKRWILPFFASASVIWEMKMEHCVPFLWLLSNSILRLRSAHYWGKNDNLAAAQCEIQKLPFFRSLFDRKIPHFYAGFHSHAEDKIEVCTTERRLSELRKKSRSFSLSIYEEGWSKQLFKFILSLICNILSENHNSTIWRPFKNAFKTLWGVVASTSTRPTRIHILSPEP